MHIKVDKEVFKFNDSRVIALSAARFPVQQFVHMIKPGDWFIFYNGTVYALTEAEYYAANRKESIQVLTKDQFQEVFKLPETSFKETDYKQLKLIESRKGKCSKCQYNAYKNKVLNILRRYPEVLTKLGVGQEFKEIPAYPEVKGTIETKVSKVFPKFFGQYSYERKSCLDCVQKHVSMAYIKGCESKQGYPEHFPMALANLQEAFQECPKDCEALRELILFCIGKSRKENELFLPLGNLLYMIDIARNETTTLQALDENQADEAFSLELSQQMKEELAVIPVTVKAKILGELEKLLRVEYDENAQNKAALFMGYLGSLADLILPFSEGTSNVLRNRRLMFKAAPQLVCNTEYDNKDLKEALLQAVKVQEKDS